MNSNKPEKKDQNKKAVLADLIGENRQPYIKVKSGGSETKNTQPTTWEVESTMGVSTWIHTEANSDHGHIKIARIHHGDKTDKEIDYQANLIASAPETLYKLQEVIKVLKTIPDYTNNQEVVNIINHVIKDFGW